MYDTSHEFPFEIGDHHSHWKPEWNLINDQDKRMGNEGEQKEKVKGVIYIFFFELLQVFISYKNQDCIIDL